MFNSTYVTHLLHVEAFGFVKANEREGMGRNTGKETRILDHHSEPGTLLGNPDASRSRGSGYRIDNSLAPDTEWGILLWDSPAAGSPQRRQG